MQLSNISMPGSIYLQFSDMIRRAAVDLVVMLPDNSAKEEPQNCITYCSNMHENNERDQTTKKLSSKLSSILQFNLYIYQNIWVLN